MGKQSRLKAERRKADPVFDDFVRNPAADDPGDGSACVVNSLYAVWGRSYDVPDIVINGERPTGLFSLSIKRHDKGIIRDWRDLMRIKNALVGEEAEAIELFPAMSRLVDSANQYWLWVIEGVAWPVGFPANEKFVADNRDSGVGGWKQRDLPPEWRTHVTHDKVQRFKDIMRRVRSETGVSHTGDTMAAARAVMKLGKGTG